MNGTWKENLSGYNHKGQRRKKQTRKHILKDKIKPLIKNFYFKNKEIEKEKFFIENQVEYIDNEQTKKKRNITIKIYKIEVIRYYGELCNSRYSTNIREAYKSVNGGYYDLYNFEPIIGNEIKELSLIDTEEFEVEQKDNSKKNNKPITYFYYNSKIYFIYGKPLEKDFFNIYGFNSCKRRKYCKKLANKRTRKNIKTWLKKGDFDKPHKNHFMEKSTSWCVD